LCLTWVQVAWKKRKKSGCKAGLLLWLAGSSPDWISSHTTGIPKVHRNTDCLHTDICINYKNSLFLEWLWPSFWIILVFHGSQTDFERINNSCWSIWSPTHHAEISLQGLPFHQPTCILDQSYTL
jgi:hypothetical protein